MVKERKSSYGAMWLKKNVWNNMCLIKTKLLKNQLIFKRKKPLGTSSSKENASSWLSRILFKYVHFENFYLPNISKLNI